MICTIDDPACRHTRARQLVCARKLRRSGKLALAGYTPPAGEGVDRLWRLAGWTPPASTIVYQPVEVRRAA